MSKRKQTQTKKKNIQRSDTDPYLQRTYAFFQAVTEDERLRFLFSPTLENKRFKKNESFFGVDDKWQSYLEQYLGTKNPDFLIEAIKEKPSLLQDRGRDLEGEKRRSHDEFLTTVYKQMFLSGESANLDFIKISNGELQSETDSIYVDGHTIVWETINWWRELYSLHADKLQAEEAKNYLLKIGHALVPERKECRVVSLGDSFIHITPKEEGKKPYLTYKSAFEFIQYWNRVKDAFKAKKHYRSKIMPLLGDVDQYHRELALVKQMHKSERKEWKRSTFSDIKGIIEKKLGDEISEDELKRFNLQDIGTITASYIAWKHEKGCPICQPKRNRKVGYKTIQRLIKEAERELKKA